jgi:hypothetical protein
MNGVVSETPQAARQTGGRRLSGSVASWASATILYAALAALAFFPVVPWSSSQILGSCTCGDIVTQVWSTSWVPHLLTSGGNPFFTDVIAVPHGASMLMNASSMFVSLLLSPITLTLGPVAAVNVGTRLAFAASALSLFAVLKKWGLRWPAAFIGGLVYGFSPYIVSQGNTHLQMAFVIIPPLWLLAWERLLTRRWTPRRAGLWLGVMAVIQFFISIDVLSTLGVMTIVGLALVAVIRRHDIRERVSDLVQAAGYACLVAVPLLAVPIYYILAGPGSFSGPEQPLSILVSYRADALSVVVPTSLQRLGPPGWTALGSSFAGGNLTENGEYLGIPLVVALLAILVWQRRSRLVITLALLGAVAYVLTLGTSLSVDGHSTWIRLPYDVLSHLPIFQDEIPIRYSLYLQLAAASLLAIGADRGLTRVLLRCEGGGRRLGTTLLALACAASVIPLWPALPYPSSKVNVPPVFTAHGLVGVPTGGAVLAYPYPVSPYDQAMLWQAVAGLNFRLFGGYIYTSTPAGTGTLATPTLTPPSVQELFTDAVWGVGDRGLPTGMSVSSVAVDLRAFLVRYDVSAVVVQEFGAYPDTVASVVTAATGKSPQHTGDVLLWRLASGGTG